MLKLYQLIQTHKFSNPKHGLVFFIILICFFSYSFQTRFLNPNYDLTQYSQEYTNLDSWLNSNSQNYSRIMVEDNSQFTLADQDHGISLIPIETGQLDVGADQVTWYTQMEYTAFADGIAFNRYFCEYDSQWFH